MVVLVDHMNFLFISFHAARRELEKRGITEFTEEHIGFFYHTLFNKYNHLFKTYGKAILCHEGKDSLKYRREIFPEYKRNRDASKKDDSYLTLKSTFESIEDVLSNYPCKQIKVDGTEADDVMYILTKKYPDLGEDVTVVSTDGDMVQLLDYSHKISVYNSIKSIFVDKKERVIDYKAIVGDPSDGIPGLYRVGKKTFEKMLLDKKLWNEKMKGGNYETYQKFLKIIDLSKYPSEIHDRILKEESETEYSDFDIGKIEYFFFENTMQDHIMRWGRDSGDIMESLREDDNIKIKGFMENPEPTSDSQLKNSTDDELDDILKEFI